MPRQSSAFVHEREIERLQELLAAAMASARDDEEEIVQLRQRVLTLQLDLDDTRARTVRAERELDDMRRNNNDAELLRRILVDTQRELAGAQDALRRANDDVTSQTLVLRKRLAELRTLEQENAELRHAKAA